MSEPPPRCIHDILTWTASKRYSDYSSIQTFNETGATDFTDLLDDFEDSYATFEQDAGYILTQNLQDRSARTGFNLADWKPKKNPAKQAAEWWEFDWEYASTPVSNLFGLKAESVSRLEKPRDGAER